MFKLSLYRYYFGTRLPILGQVPSDLAWELCDNELKNWHL